MTEQEQEFEETPNQEEAPRPALDWAAAKQNFAKEEQARKKVIFENVGENGEPLEFWIKQLSAPEFDQIRNQVARRAPARSRNGDSGTTVDNHALHVAIVKRGVTEGPKGWQGTTDDVDCLPRKIRDDLADMIDDFSSLREETRVKFRPVGKGDEDRD